MRYANHNLDGDEPRQHIADGKQCTRLALTWADKISFVLTDGLKIKRINYTVLIDSPPACLDDIEPQHIRLYRTWRMEKAKQWYLSQGRTPPPEAGGVRANRELALFSHIFNYSREMGLTSASNPSSRVRKTRETGRDVYIEDDVYKAVYTAADQPLRDAMDLAYLTGQRPADTLALDQSDIKNGVLEIQQGKTGKRLRITIEGELEAVIIVFS